MRTRKQLIAIARREYQTDDIEIDDNAKISRTDENGAWVQAWVWVSDEVPE